MHTVISDKSQGSVAALLSCGGIFSYHLTIAMFGSENNFKIGECLAKVRAKRLVVLCALFALQ